MKFQVNDYVIRVGTGKKERVFRIRWKSDLVYHFYGYIKPIPHDQVDNNFRKVNIRNTKLYKVLYK